MATEYGVIVKAIPDTNSFDEDLNKKLKGKKRKIDINVAVSEEAVKKLNNIDERFKKIKQTVQTGFKVELFDEKEIDGKLTKVSQGFREVTKVVQQFKDKAGEIQTVVSYVDNLGNIIESQVTKSQKVFEGYNKTLSDTASRLKVIAKETNVYKNSKGEKVTVENTTNNAGQEIKRTTYEMEELGKKTKVVTEQTRLANGQWEKAKEVLREVYNNEVALTEAQKKDKEKILNQLVQEREAIRKRNEELQKAKEEKVYKDKEKALNQLVQEREAIRKRNEELQKSTILYEEYIKTKTKDGNLTINKVTNKAGQTEQKEVLEYEDKYGRLIQETNKYLIERDGTVQKIGDSHVKIVNDQIAKEEEANKKAIKEHNELVASLKKVEQQQKNTNKAVITYKDNEKKIFDFKDKSIHAIQEETKAITNLAGDTKYITTVTDKWVDVQGMLHTKISTTKDGITTYTETIEKMKKGMSGLGQSFSDVIVKVAKFYLASLPIRAVQSAITNAIQSVKDFDSALTEFKKVSDLSGESLDKYTEKLEKLGKLTARTRKHSVREHIVICA